MTAPEASSRARAGPAGGAVGARGPDHRPQSRPDDGPRHQHLPGGHGRPGGGGPRTRRSGPPRCRWPTPGRGASGSWWSPTPIPTTRPGAAGLAARTGAEVVGFSARDGFVPARDGGRRRPRSAPGTPPSGPCTPRATPRTICAGSWPRSACCSRGTTSWRARRWSSPPRRGHGAVPGQPAPPPRPGSARWPTIAPGHGSLSPSPAGRPGAIDRPPARRERRCAAPSARAGRATVDELAARRLRRRARRAAPRGPPVVVGAPAQARPTTAGPAVTTPTTTAATSDRCRLDGLGALPAVVGGFTGRPSAGLDVLEHAGRAARQLHHRGDVLDDARRQRVEGRPQPAAAQGHRRPGVAGGGHVGVQRHRAHQRARRSRRPGARRRLRRTARRSLP